MINISNFLLNLVKQYILTQSPYPQITARVDTDIERKGQREKNQNALKAIDDNNKD